jgi:hypothetical protein
VSALGGVPGTYSARNPIFLLLVAGTPMSERSASKTALNWASYFRSRVASLRARSACDERISRRRTKGAAEYLGEFGHLPLRAHVGFHDLGGLLVRKSANLGWDSGKRSTDIGCQEESFSSATKLDVNGSRRNDMLRRKAAPTLALILATALCGCGDSSSGAGGAGDGGSGACGYAACLNKIFAHCSGKGSCVTHQVDDGDLFVSRTCWANGDRQALTADRVNRRAHIVAKNGSSVCWSEDQVATDTADGASTTTTATITDAKGALIGTYTFTTDNDNVTSTCAGSDAVTTLSRCPVTFDGEHCSSGTCDI